MSNQREEGMLVINSSCKEKILQYARQESKDIPWIWVAPEIPEDKLQSARAEFPNFDGNESPLILIAISIKGSGKKGLVFTDNRLIINDFNTRNQIQYADIKTVTFDAASCFSITTTSGVYKYELGNEVIWYRSRKVWGAFSAKLLNQIIPNLTDSDTADVLKSHTQPLPDENTIANTEDNANKVLFNINEDSGFFTSLISGAFAGAIAVIVSHYISKDKLTFTVWLVAYILCIVPARRKAVATITFIIVGALVYKLYTYLF